MRFHGDQPVEATQGFLVAEDEIRPIKEDDVE